MKRKYYKYTNAYMRYLKYRHEVQDYVWKMKFIHRIPLGNWKGNEEFFERGILTMEI